MNGGSTAIAHQWFQLQNRYFEVQVKLNDGDDGQKEQPSVLITAMSEVNTAQPDGGISHCCN